MFEIKCLECGNVAKLTTDEKGVFQVEDMEVFASGDEEITFICSVCENEVSGW